METAILIGSHLVFLIIGAIIAGWCAWVFRAQGASAASAREETARRLALVEEVALQTGTLHHRFQRYCSLLSELSRADQGLSANRQLELDKAHQELAILTEELSEADSKLLLLDEVALARALRVYAGKIQALRRQYPGNRQQLTEELLKKHLQEVNTLRDKLFSSLSRRYGQRHDGHS